jgi:hypothetical protein
MPKRALLAASEYTRKFVGIVACCCSHNHPVFCSAHRPLVLPDRLNARRRPMFPKHRQQQNKMLNIQIPFSTARWLARPPSIVGGSDWLVEKLTLWLLNDERLAGAGTTSGMKLITTAEPTNPTVDDRRKPGLDRSIRYQRNGLTRARLRET